MTSKPPSRQPDSSDKKTDIQEQQRQEAGLNDDGAGPTEVSSRASAKGEKAEKADKADKQQIGEGSYEATRDYQDNIKQYLDRADVKDDAKAAKPDSPEHDKELKKAEDEGLSHSKSPGQ